MAVTRQTQTSPQNNSSNYIQPEQVFGDVRTIQVDSAGAIPLDQIHETVRQAHQALETIYEGGNIQRGKWMRRLVRNLRQCTTQLAPEGTSHSS